MVCVDILSSSLEPHGFDFVTIVGSTATETGDEHAALLDAARLLRPGGRRFCAGLLDRVPFPAVRLVAHQRDDRLAELPFHLFVVESSTHV